jgi:hypothetical protein
MNMGNFLNIFLQFFLLSLNYIFNEIKQKIWIILPVINYIYKSLYKVLDDWFNNKFEDKSFSKEMKSLLFATIFAFFFYYFIVIELSILVFGYSLLCYWFLFLFIFICFIISWRLEVIFLKYSLTSKEKWFITDDNWVMYYDGESPYSLYDYITDYRKKPLFKYTVIDSNWEEIEDGWSLNLTIFILFIFTFFYLCSYWFWPNAVAFVSHFFYPIVNFFEIWSEPRFTDFYSAAIWFWNWFVFFFEYKYKDQPFKLSLIEKIPAASPKWEDRSERIWLNKTSLRKNSDFGDIFFLWELRTHYPVYKLVFGYDQPTVLADWFEPNIPFFFLRYLRGQFDLTKKSFWRTHFTEDPWLWKHVTRYRDDYNTKILESEFWQPYMYFTEDVVIPSYTDLLLSQNYFDDISPISQKSFFDYGAHWEMYSNIINPKLKTYMTDFTILEQTLVRGTWVPYPQSYFGLFWHNRLSKDKDAIYTKKMLKKKNWDAIKSIFKTQGFNFKNFKNFINPKIIDVSLDNFLTFPIYEDCYPLKIEDLQNSNQDELIEFLKWLDWRLAVLEEKFSIEPLLFEADEYDWVTWEHLVTLVLRWVWWLDTYINKWNFISFIKNNLPTWYEIVNAINSSYKPSWWMKKIYERIQNSRLHLHVPPTEDVIKDFISLEKIMWDFERYLNLRQDNKSHYYRENEYFFRKPVFFPWYVWSIKYFNSLEWKFAFPGFEWFVVPTPYPAPFSTFGLNWFRYQIYWLEHTSLFISESISYVGDWASAPTILYTGVEAIMYFRPILKIFDIISNIFIKILGYPMEFIVTKIPWISERMSVLAFLVHLTWFLHFYIYAFLFLYCFYYFVKFYYYRSTYMWIYEWMFETAFINQNNGFVYWHTLTDIWSNYKHPQQFAVLSLQTTLLLYYTFNNYLNFLITTKYGNFKFLSFLTFFFHETKDIIKYFTHNNNKTMFYKNLLNITNFKFFKFFCNINYKKYSMLMYSGGSDWNVDFMVWDYFDYLSQTSIYISWSLLKNKYFKNHDSWFLTLIKHMTILFTSCSLSTNFYFLSMPLLDTVLAWKLILELLTLLEYNNYDNNEIFLKKFLYNTEEFKTILGYSLFLNSWFNFFNFFTSSGLDFYKIFDVKELNFTSKYTKQKFWDSEKFWLFAFFWSFRFISWLRYPYMNLSWNHETNRLQLRWVAYTNSWIGSTINIWPFFNMIQHIWWTSRVYTRAFSITDNYLNINLPGISNRDLVRNFLEKRYPLVNQNKVETMFGSVWSLSLFVGKKFYNKGTWFSYSLFNYDLTYPISTVNRITTNRMYPKTNPPLNLIKLEITPFWLFNFFKYISSLHPFYYLTFFEQLELIDSTLYKNFKWELKKEYKTIPFFNIEAKLKNPKKTSTFDFYLKKFDSLLMLDKKNELSNWVFSFDTSFFFNHFLTWDFLLENQEEVKFNKITDEIKKNKLFFILKNQSFSEINSKYTTANHWFQKPFGVLDKYELINMQKYKSSKSLDILSLTSNKENNFNFLEKETLKKLSGLSILDFEDGRTSTDSYNEKFLGERLNWYSFNNTFTSNLVSPILLGWVGDIYYSTQDSTSILLSTLYATDESNPHAFKENQSWFFPYVNFVYRDYFLNSYFSYSKIKKQLYSWLFSWINLTIFPTSFWNFFGVKSISWLDYWSWKCGIQIDYWNGFYNYWPYLGYWHAFGSKLMVFDSMYGFYWSYWQIEDDPTILDLETDAMEQLYDDNEEEVSDKHQYQFTYKDFFDINNSEDWEILRDLSLTYWEIYFSFHHPYFLGYFLFWFFTLLTNKQYLGLVNFSLKWLIIWNFITFNNSLDFIDFTLINSNWTEYENKYRKNMFWYWMYFINSIKLTTNFTNSLEPVTSTPFFKDDHITEIFLDLKELLDFFKASMNFTFTDLNFLLDCKKIDLQLLKINWYNLDMPFPLNPFLVVNKLMINSFDIDYEKIYNSYFLSFSHYDSLWENINLNMLFDDFLGTYFDAFNFISYYSTYRSLSSLPEHYLDKPNYLATHNLWFWFDLSKKMASKLFNNIETYDNHDMLTGYGLLLQNLFFLKFFVSSLEFIFILSANMYNYWYIWIFLELYLKKTEFGLEFARLWQKDILPEDWQYSPLIYPVNSYFSHQKHFFFLFQFCWVIPYDLLTVWLDLGILFFSKKSLRQFFFLKKISISNRFLFLKWFYSWIGYQLYVFFFNKN